MREFLLCVANGAGALSVIIGLLGLVLGFIWLGIEHPRSLWVMLPMLFLALAWVIGRDIRDAERL